MGSLRTYLAPLLAGLLLIGVAGPLASPANARPFVTGVTVPDTGQVSQLGYDRIRDAGASFTRVSIFWKYVAPSNKPSNWSPADPADSHYDWSYIDHQVTSAVNAGLTPMIQIYQAPKWAERCVAPGEPGICNPDPVAFQQFATAAVKRYSGDFQGLPRVRYWEPWNEPNLHIFFKPQRIGNKRPSPTLYRELLNRFAAAVKRNDSSNLVVGGGLAPLGGKNSIGPLDFTRRLLCMEGRRNPKPIRGCSTTARFDIWAVNPYTTGGPTHRAIDPDDVQLGDVAEMVRLVRTARRYGKIKSASRVIPVWVTEFSWDSKPPDPNGLPMGLLSRWTAEAMYRSWKAGVDNFFWLSLRDWARPSGLPYSQTVESGLWFRGNTLEKDRPKQVLKAFRYPFVAFRTSRGISVWGRTPASSPGNVTIRFGNTAGRVNRQIKVVRANRFGVFQAMIRTGLGSNRRGFVNATIGNEVSLPFSLRPVRDFYHPPFG